MLLVLEPSWLAWRNIDGVPKSQCSLGVRAPRQQLARGGERAVVVIAEDYGDDGLILEVAVDDRFERCAEMWGWYGQAIVGIEFAHQYDCLRSGRICYECLEMCGYVRDMHFLRGCERVLVLS